MSSAAPTKEAVANSLKVIREASDEEIYTFMKNERFSKKIYTPWYAATMFSNHYLLDFLSGITMCGRYRLLNSQSNRPRTLTGDCRACNTRYRKALERYIHEEIFAVNPENPLEGFMSLNDHAKKLTENYSEKKLISFLAKQILLN